MLMSNMVPSRRILKDHFDFAQCSTKANLRLPHLGLSGVGGQSSWAQLLTGSLWCQSPLPWPQWVAGEVKLGAEGLFSPGTRPSERGNGEGLLRTKQRTS